MKGEYDFRGGTRGRFFRPHSHVKLPYHRRSQSWLVDVAATGRWWHPEFWREADYLAASPWNAQRVESAFKALIQVYTADVAMSCHANDCVGDYVPFYFCPRSIMLFVIHCANSPDLAYRGGQAPIVHLQSDLHAVVAWARQHDRRWAFSLSNAGARYANFHATLADLEQLDWGAIDSTDFRRSAAKEAKQAEFLVHGSFPWDLVEALGAISDGVRRQAVAAIAASPHQPIVTVRPKWYY